MTARNHRFSLILLTLGLLSLLLAGIVAAQDDDDTPVETPEATTEPAAPAAEPAQDLSILDNEVEVAIEPTGNNGYCTICHDQPLRTIRLEDGTLLNLYVNPEMIVGSVHGPSEDSPGLGCLDCHGEDAFPHSGPPPADGRVYTLEMVNLCTDCHVTAAEDMAMGLHTQAIADGNLQAAVCTDCHGAHHIQSAENQPELVAGVCGDCHENTLEEWRISAHADIGPLGCASCHNYHAQTLRVGDTSTALCINCHNEMPSIYSHETHLTGDNPVACVECHMYREDNPQLISLEEPSTGHTMLLDSTPCTTCHAELTESGEWQNIINERLIDPDAPDVLVEVEPVAVPQEEITEEVLPANTISIVQGLLVGLGLGVTFTIVFVTRSLRSRDE